MRKRRSFAWSALLLALLAVLAVVYTWRSTAPGPVPDVPWSEPLVHRDLEQVRTDTLKVLVLRDPLTWERRPKAESGLELELVERFCKQTKLRLKVVPASHLDTLFLWLQQGKGDVLLAQLAHRKDHARWVAFTRAYRTVQPMLAVLRDDPMVNGTASDATVDRAVDSVVIGPWSPFADPQYRLDPRVKQRLAVHAPPASNEDLLLEVVMGRHTAVVVSDARAGHGRDVFPVVEYDGPVGPPQGLCFAVRRNSPELLQALNEHLAAPKEEEARELLMKGYGAALPKPGPLKRKRGVPVLGDSISPYDTWFRQHADGMGWDWELLAVMAWKESRFDSTVTSSKGAMGIMQLMPRTAERLGLDSSHAMDDHIRAAVRYLSKLDTLWMRAIPDREQRLRFVLGSYNAGPGHIIDAQRLAEHLGLDPDRWEHNVERAVLLKAVPHFYQLPFLKNGYCKGSQVFHYVRDVVSMYHQLKARPRSSSKRATSSAAGKAGT